VTGAAVSEAGYARGPNHFHDGVEEWMYVVSGEPVLRDPIGKRPLKPVTLVAFRAGPDGALTDAELQRIADYWTPSATAAWGTSRALAAVDVLEGA
jgi:hypothetical protein